MSIIGFLVALILICLAFWVVREVTTAFGLPAPIVKIIYVFMVIIVVLALLQMTGMLTSGPQIRLQ